MENSTNSRKHGGIKECPNCGAPWVSGETQCKECGHYLIDAQANSSTQLLDERLRNARERDKAGIIRSFPIPNSREDLIEFLTSLEPKAHRKDKDEETKAYREKYRECLNKARISFPDDPTILRFLEIEKGNKKKQYLIYGGIGLLVVIIILLIIFTSINGANMKKVTKLINQEKYQEAELVLNEYNESLESFWSGSNRDKKVSNYEQFMRESIVHMCEKQEYKQARLFLKQHERTLKDMVPSWAKDDVKAIEEFIKSMHQLIVEYSGDSSYKYQSEDSPDAKDFYSEKKYKKEFKEYNDDWDDMDFDYDTPSFDEIDIDNIQQEANNYSSKSDSQIKSLSKNIPKSGSLNQFKWLSQQQLSTIDLQDLSKYDLRILRNAIYAMHGYNFQSPDLQSYFGHFSDYKPTTYNVTDFNPTEQANINLIKSME